MLEMVRLKQRHPVSPARVRHWFASPQAVSLLQAENRWLQTWLEQSFGSYLLLYNAVSDAGHASRIRHQVRLGSSEQLQDIHCSECQWPVTPEGADVVLLQHSLEFASSPYNLLREAARAVRPGGHLLIIGRNPWWPGLLGRGLWRRSHRLSAGRVAEWLAVLGFAVDDPFFAHYQWAYIQSKSPTLETFLAKRQWPLGACYMMSARKMVHAAPLQRQRNTRVKGILPLPVARQEGNPEIAKEQRTHE